MSLLSATIKNCFSYKHTHTHTHVTKKKEINGLFLYLKKIIFLFFVYIFFSFFFTYFAYLALVHQSKPLMFLSETEPILRHFIRRSIPSDLIVRNVPGVASRLHNGVICGDPLKNNII